MMNDSYIDEIKKTFPKIELPLTEDQLQRVEAAARMKPQEIYVAKSERIATLEKELATTRDLYNRANALANTWDKQMWTQKWFKFNRYKVPYVNCPQLESPKEAIDSILADAEKQVNALASRMHCAANELRQMLTFVYNDLEAALEAEKKGVAGESRVEDYLVRNLNCRVLSGVILPAPDSWNGGPKTAETDLLVVSEYGVYVCEVKNYGKAGQSLEVMPSGEIIKKAGTVLENMGSPFRQNARHCKAVESVLAGVGMADFPVYSAVIMANTDVQVLNNSQYQVFDMYSFCEHLSRKKVARFTMEQCQAAFSAIQAKRLAERSFPLFAVSSIAGELGEALECFERGTENGDALCKATQEAIDAWSDDAGAKWASTHKRPFRIERMVGAMRTASAWAIAVWAVVFGVRMLLLDVPAMTKLICVGAVLLAVDLSYFVWAKVLPVINRRAYTSKKSLAANFVRMVAIHLCFVALFVLLVVSTPLCDMFTGDVPDDVF